MTNCDINVNEVTSNTFGLNLSFELLTQVPSKIIFDYESEQQANAKYNEIRYLKFDNVNVPCNKDYEYIELKLKKDNDILTYYCPCVKDLDNFILNGEFKNNDLKINLHHSSLPYAPKEN